MLRALLILLCLLLHACGGDPKFPTLPAGASVLAFGDSVTAGVGAGPGEDYPSRLQALSAWTVHNAGVSGDTAAAARNRIDEALERTRPRLVIIEIGGNDFLRQSPAARVKEDIRFLIGKAHASGARVVLVAVPAYAPIAAAMGGLHDAELYRELAEEEEVVLVEDVFSDILSDKDLRADPIHPNRLGYQRLAEGIAETLEERGLLRAVQ